MAGSQLGKFRPRNLIGLIGETFRIYRRNFWPFVIIAAIPQAVSFFVPVFPVVDTILGLIGGFLWVIAFGATIYAVARQNSSQGVDVAESYRRALSKVIYLIEKSQSKRRYASNSDSQDHIPHFGLCHRCLSGRSPVTNGVTQTMKPRISGSRRKAKRFIGRHSRLILPGCPYRKGVVALWPTATATRPRTPLRARERPLP